MPPSSLEAALYYASLGWAVFPAEVQPFRPLVPRGCYDATKDVEQIKELWRTRPDAGVAVATGRVSDLVVIDIDHKHGRDGRASLAPLLQAEGGFPLTWISFTPSGGQHVFFRHPEALMRNRVDALPGVDIRADGGAIALPPSGDSAYRWFEPPGRVPMAPLPEWLLNALVTGPTVIGRSHRPLRFGSLQQRMGYVQAVARRTYFSVANAVPGTRNDALFKAACRLGELIPALLTENHAEALLMEAAEASGLSRDDGPRAVRATIRSGLRRGRQSPQEVL